MVAYGCRPGVWEITLFSVSSQIYDHLCIENSPSIPSFLVTKIVYIEYGQLKKYDSFSFYLSIAVLLVFLYLIAAYARVGQCVIIICRCPQNILKYLFPEKCSSKYVVKNARNVTQLCDLILLNFKGLSKKIIKYIHQNLRYYETIEQIHFMVVKKRKLCLGKKL